MPETLTRIDQPPLPTARVGVAARRLRVRRLPERVRPLLTPLAALAELARALRPAWAIARARIGGHRGEARLGALWWIIDPLLQIGAWFLFVAFVRGQAAGIDHALAIAAAFVPWRIFQGIASGTGEGYIKGAALLRIPRLPRMTLPLAAALHALFTSLFALLVLLAIVLLAGPTRLLDQAILGVAPLLLLTVGCALGFGLCLAALQPFSPDLRRFMKNAFRLLFFATPVLYPLSNAPLGAWRDALYLNPLAGLFEGFRGALGAGPLPDPITLLPALTFCLVTVPFGALLCRRVGGRVASVV